MSDHWRDRRLLETMNKRHHVPKEQYWMSSMIGKIQKAHEATV